MQQQNFKMTICKYRQQLWHPPFAIGLLVIVAILGFYYAEPMVTTAVLASAIRQATPLILGALCGLVGERAGVMNIGIEGQMLFSAYVAFIANAWTGNLFLSVWFGVLAGALMGLLLAFMSVTLKIDQIISGIVINTLALGLTGYFFRPGMITAGKLQPFPLGPLADIPLLGPVIFSSPPITYMAVLLVIIMHYILFYTHWGLCLRAVGEHPGAADSQGINVRLMRYIAVTVGGAIAGIGGGFLTLEAVGSFERGMTNGRGFIALAVMIFGKWTPLGSWGAALLFGLATALQTQLQFAGRIHIPHQFIGMLPYLLTIVVLAGFVGRSRPPAAVGTPYERE
jgi:simple sugar transport system permease protein